MTSRQSAISAVRFGYGLRPGEDAPGGPEGVMQQLRSAKDEALMFPPEGTGELRQRAIATFMKRRDMRKDLEGEDLRAALKTVRQENERRFRSDAIARTAQSVASPNGLQERLAFFWTDHFSVSFRKNEDMRQFTPLFEVEAIRPNLAADFSTLLKAATLHPAMIFYLDQWLSVGPHSARAGKRGLNENHGRELLELHTLGAGSGYTQTDVRQASLLMTGLTIDRPGAETIFDGKRAEPGTFSVLGKVYGQDRSDIADINRFLDDLSVRPETARYISRKLATYFFSEDPSPELVSAMEQTWRRTGGNLSAVYETMLADPAAFTMQPRNIKLPFDYVVSCLRALNVDGETIVSDEKLGGTVNYLLKTLGQPVWDPPSPEGFESNRASWVNGNQLAGRIVVSRNLINKFRKDQEPVDFANRALGPLLSENTGTLVKRAPNRTAAMTLVLASPEFNLR
ncbi:DUF1800 domain-containing protein [Martelella mangrovi]